MAANPEEELGGARLEIALGGEGNQLALKPT
jgi:hypothetical protein